MLDDPDLDDLTPAQIAAAQLEDELRYERSLAVASNLIAERLPGRFAIYHDIDEGKVFPDGTVDISGHVLDDRDDDWFFWIDWDEAAGRPVLSVWRRDEANDRNAAADEYRRARALVGLPPLPRPEVSRT